MNLIQHMLKARGHSNPEAYDLSPEESKLRKELEDVLVALSFLNSAKGLTPLQNNLLITTSQAISNFKMVA